MLIQIPIPASKRAPGRRSSELHKVAARCTMILTNHHRYGLNLTDLHRHLAVDLDTVRYSIPSVWLSRLIDNELPDPRPTRRPRANTPDPMPAKPPHDLTGKELIARGLDPRFLPSRMRTDKATELDLLALQDHHFGEE